MLLTVQKAILIMGVICEESGEKGMDNAFMESYSDALNKELSMTTIEKSLNMCTTLIPTMR